MLIPQDPFYHDFADQRAFLGVPNFWNVVSNAMFLLVALFGLRDSPPRAPAYWTMLAGIAAVTFGSGYYHWNPNDPTLFWDRLPMTIVFMSIVAIVTRANNAVLCGLLVLGASSVLYWRWSGDLLFYGIVQFGSLLRVIALRWRERPIWLAALLYGIAKVLEMYDRPIGQVIATGGHPWKHLFAAAALWVFVRYARSVLTTEPATSVKRN